MLQHTAATEDQAISAALRVGRRKGGILPKAMAYLIRRREPVEDEVRRILTEQNDKALTLIEHWQDNPREHVHSARQAFKRLRALLRLIRPAARYVFTVENRFYRDIARSLAYVRDSDAVVEALTFIETNTSDIESINSLRLLRTGLEQRVARELADPVLDVARRVQAACEALHEAAGRLRHVPLPGLGRKVVRSSARKGLRRCEKSFGQVLLTGADGDFHHWRQDVKCSYHHTRLMQELMPEWADHYGPPLARLAELLGHNQDLVVLDSVLQRQPDELRLDRDMQRIRDIIAACQQDLQKEARTLGAQIFLQPPKYTPGPQTDAATTANEPAAAAETPVTEATKPEPAAEEPPANVVDFATRRTGGESNG